MRVGIEGLASLTNPVLSELEQDVIERREAAGSFIALAPSRGRVLAGHSGPVTTRSAVLAFLRGQTAPGVRAKRDRSGAQAGA